METDRKPYGVELILDLHECDPSTFTKDHLERYIVEVCSLIDMERHGEPMYWLDDSGIPHLNGVSAVQFIKTSTLVLHCMDIMKVSYVNIFSCKEFDTEVAKNFTQQFFKASDVKSQMIVRN